MQNFASVRKKSFNSMVSDGFKKVWVHKWLYMLLLPVLAYYIIFKYVPMYGIVMAFQDYNVFKGVFGSQFVGFEVFQRIFDNNNFWSAIKNTLLLNFLGLLVSFPAVIIVSLMLNEVTSAKFKKMSQSILYLPHFISWVVVAGISVNMFNMQTGTISNILQSIGLEPIPFLSDNAWWTFVYTVTNLWKEIGWGTIIYLAALSGVDETLYEAAYLDGATKLQRLIKITLPSITPVIVTMLLLQVSKMMTIGLDAPLLLGNDKVMGVSEVISTYTYRLGIQNAKYSDSTAIGLFQSIVNIVILVIADRFTKSIGEDGIM